MIANTTAIAPTVFESPLGYRIGPDDNFAPIDVLLLRASEFEARAAMGVLRCKNGR